MSAAEFLPWVAVAIQLMLLAIAAGKAQEKLSKAEERLKAQEASFTERLNRLDETWGARCNKLDAAFERRIGELNAKQATFDTFAEATLRDRATLISEVATLKSDAVHAEQQREATNTLIQKTREEVASFQATIQEQNRSLERGMEALQRGLDGANRQLANIAANGLGFTPPGKPRRGSNG